MTLARTIPAARRRLDIVAVLLAPLGVLLVVLSQAFDGVALRTLLHGPAALIVIGGTLGALLVSYSVRELMAAARACGRAFQASGDDTGAVAASMVALAIRAHRRGVIAIEQDVDALTDPFLRNAMALAVDGVSVETLRHIMAAERAARLADDELPARVLDAAAGYAPTMGILGAVLGLVRVMEHLTVPGALGPGIAVAFVSTVYGVGLANLVLLPAAGRLRERAERHDRRRALMAEGVHAIHERSHPRLVAQRLGALAAAMPSVEEIAVRMSRTARAGTSRASA